MSQVVPIQGNRARRSLQARFESLGLLADLPIGICCCDASGVVVLSNRQAAMLWGRIPEAGITRFDAAHRVFSPDGNLLQPECGPVSQVIGTGAPIRNQRLMLERPDGTRIAVLVNADPLYDEDGTLAGVVSCFHDITELSGSLTDLDQSKEDLEDFFENGAVALHIVAGDGTILRANKAELALLGYSVEEYIGRHISEFHLDQEVATEILARLERGELLEKYPARMRAKDGSIRHVQITSSAQFRNGEFVRTRCFTFDVTDLRLAEMRRYESEQLSRAVLEGVPAAIYTTDAEGRITFFNQACVELAGRSPKIGTDQWCVSWRLYTPDGAPLAHEDCPMAVALKEARPVRGMELIVERPDGSRARVLPHPTPLFDDNGRLTGAVNMLIDVTEHHQAHLHLAHLAAIVASSDDAIVSKTLDGMITSWNAGATRIFGYEEHEMVGQPITRIIPPELHGEEQEVLTKLRKGERIDHFETARLAKDGRRIDVSLTVSPIRDRSGKIVGASKVGRDITERKHAEEMQRLLIGELNHRVKNTLATVQSMANQTVHSARSPGDFMASFIGRLQALAQTHTMLTQSAWQGANVEELIRDQLLLGGDEDGQITCSGPAVMLHPQAALHLALVLHELGTNARKYGALSSLAGRLLIRWVVRSNESGNCLLVQWKEHGGPPVEAPAQRGFGTTLIHQSLSAHAGDISIEYPPEGVICEISLPLPEGTTVGAYRSHAETAPRAAVSRRTPVPSEPPKSASLAAARVLVVEDEPLVAIDVAATLSKAGCKVIGPAATLDNANSLVEKGDLEVAILDANLAGDSVDELAAELARRKIPFAFLTGYGPDCLPQEFRHAPLVDKPFNPQQLLTVVQELLEQA